MIAAYAANNHGDERGLTWHLQPEIYTSIPIWSYSHDLEAAAQHQV